MSNDGSISNGDNGSSWGSSSSEERRTTCVDWSRDRDGWCTQGLVVVVFFLGGGPKESEGHLANCCWSWSHHFCGRLGVLGVFWGHVGDLGGLRKLMINFCTKLIRYGYSSSDNIWHSHQKTKLSWLQLPPLNFQKMFNHLPLQLLTTRRRKSSSPKLSPNPGHETMLKQPCKKVAVGKKSPSTWNMTSTVRWPIRGRTVWLIVVALVGSLRPLCWWCVIRQKRTPGKGLKKGWEIWWQLKKLLCFIKGSVGCMSFYVLLLPLPIKLVFDFIYWMWFIWMDDSWKSFCRD